MMLVIAITIIGISHQGVYSQIFCIDQDVNDLFVLIIVRSTLNFL